jgi:hypothetical protein
MGTPTFDGPEPQDPDLLPSSEEAGGDLAERRDLPDNEDTEGGQDGATSEYTEGRAGGEDPMERATFDVTG